MLSLVDPARIKIAVGSLRLRGSERALVLGLPVRETIGIGMRFVLPSFDALSRGPKIDQFRHFFISRRYRNTSLPRPHLPVRFRGKVLFLHRGSIASIYHSVRAPNETSTHG